MSGGNDNIFARWSRRKLAARTSTDQAPDDEKHALDASVENAGVDSPLAPEEEAAEPETDEPAEPLPRIEDLTPDSDLSAFLRKGVPKALRSAAMRKMWSLDPGIRDYVGPAEYAWDFNQPGSMAGFGTLEAEEAAVNFLSKIGGGIDTDQEERAATAETLPVEVPQSATNTSSEQQAKLSTDEADDAAPLNAPAGSKPVALPGPPPVPAPTGVPTRGAESAEPEQTPQTATRARHGGAMPR